MNSFAWIMLSIVSVMLVQILSVVLRENRYPYKMTAWLLILFILPIIGWFMYILTDFRFHRRHMHLTRGQVKSNMVKKEYEVSQVQEIKELDKPINAHECVTAGFSGTKLPHSLQNIQQESNVEFSEEIEAWSCLEHIPGIVRCEAEHVEVLTNAELTYAGMEQAIRMAKDHVHVQFYTIRNDRCGTQFQQMLIQKAEEGVTVRVLVDGVGSYQLPESYMAVMRAAGIQTARFLPPAHALFAGQLNYRNHRKLVIIDGKRAFVGGLNIGDEYLGRNKQLGFWRDTHLCLDGMPVHELQKSFISDWQLITEQTIEGKRYYPLLTAKSAPNHVEHQIGLVFSGPEHAFTLQMLVMAILSAKERVWISTPYFVPDEALRLALRLAASRGVEVSILIPGDHSDSKLVLWSSLSYVEEGLHAGVTFYRYAKGFIHAKVMLIDHKMAIIGTANLDMRSLFTNFEICVCATSMSVILHVERDFKQDMQDSQRINPVTFLKRSRKEKTKEMFGRLLSALL